MMAIVRQFLPPMLIKAFKPRSKYGWFGNYETWDDAQNKCTGYNSSDILNKVKQATLKVRNGESVFERDSVLFDSIQYSWPLLSALMWIAAANKGKLNVLDFGGSLGTSYFQNKWFLNDIETLTWNIVEQDSFVNCGKQFFQDSRLKFFYSIDAAIAENGVPDLIVIACTLPYLECPYNFLSEIQKYHIPHMIIDNTFFNYQRRDRIVVQRVPPQIYRASYPCWLLDYTSVLSLVSRQYNISAEYRNESIINVDGRKVQYRGFIAKAK
jgi:putative methyltransferase (TIGR04325 family)